MAHQTKHLLTNKTSSVHVYHSGAIVVWCNSESTLNVLCSRSSKNAYVAEAHVIALRDMIGKMDPGNGQCLHLRLLRQALAIL